MSIKASFELFASLLAGATLVGCTADIQGGAAGAGTGPAGLGNAGTAGSMGGGGSGMTPDGGLPSPVCQAGSVVPSFHRLNRIEYQNSVNALLGTDLPIANDLPVDSLVYGFDNNADVSMSATLMQKYLNAAQTAVGAALSSNTTRAALIPCTLGADTACARSVLEKFLAGAFRRPASAAEVEDSLGYLKVCSSSPQAGIGCAMQAALLSSKFLFRAELLGTEQAKACTEAAPLASSADGKLSPHALAARLSYWLTTSAPDAELYAAATSGALNEPTGLATQVQRLLAVPSVGSHRAPFLENFPGQWLQLSAAAAAAPSPTLFPKFDEPLRQALGDESRLFFASAVNEGRSALDLVRSDFSFLNERLASHYGIAGVTGAEMRRVSTAGTLRGGILTQASFLTATSSSENTSIVQRAKWVLTNLLCEHLPLPPPGIVDSVPPPDPGLGLTNRESLSIRTKNPPCNGCHLTMNPIGFGLEVFDAVGALRSTDKGKPIDASGQLPDGQMFQDTEGLMQLLKQDPRFPACMTKKVLTYALGRGLEAACDADALNQLGTAWKADGYNLKNHIVRLAQSDLFRSSRAFVDPSVAVGTQGQETAP
jgi:Protein of unknown function (DUF1592)/Protein of unknown function (DUF1588)/Protein of unknown function (DUF1587)/Protein of unknown function (DUF1585)/Protein of unknown function (DUF1595)